MPWVFWDTSRYCQVESIHFITNIHHQFFQLPPRLPGWNTPGNCHRILQRIYGRTTGTSCSHFQRPPLHHRCLKWLRRYWRCGIPDTGVAPGDGTGGVQLRSIQRYLKFHHLKNPGVRIQNEVTACKEFSRFGCLAQNKGSRYYLIPAKDLDDGDNLRLINQLEEVSKLLDAYLSSILDSGSWILWERLAIMTIWYKLWEMNSQSDYVRI